MLVAPEPEEGGKRQEQTPEYSRLEAQEGTKEGYDLGEDKG